MKRRRGTRFSVLSKGLRRKRGEMNATEAAYAALLEVDDDVYEWWFEPFTLRLSRPAEGQPAKYTPDFLVLMNDGVTFIDDVKGSGVDDDASRVRIKCAAEQYQLWRFRIVKKRRVRDGGGFDVTEV